MKSHPHSILSSVRELLEAEKVPDELAVIDVVWHEGLLYVAGSSNRRLCMWRLLALFRPTRFSQIQVRVKDRDDRTLHFWDKYTTHCAGSKIRVDPSHIVGSRIEEVDWDAARAIFNFGPLFSNRQETVFAFLNQMQGRWQQGAAKYWLLHSDSGDRKLSVEHTYDDLKSSSYIDECIVVEKKDGLGQILYHPDGKSSWTLELDLTMIGPPVFLRWVNAKYDAMEWQRVYQ